MVFFGVCFFLYFVKLSAVKGFFKWRLTQLVHELALFCFALCLIVEVLGQVRLKMRQNLSKTFYKPCRLNLD